VVSTHCQPAAASGTPPAPTAAPAADFPSAEEIAANWPRFRGPDGSGNPALTNLPESWDGPSGKNIVWKTPLDLPGKNSAVVWGGRVFTTGANQSTREVYCHEAATGKLLWKGPVATPQSARAEQPEVMEDTGYAAPTAVTDGRRVCAIFANGDVGAFTVAGEPLWNRSLGTPENMYGHATSLALWRNILLVVFDQATAEDGKSKVFGLDTATGKSLWETPRPVANSWVSPIIIEVNGKPQLITSADPWVIAYDPATGREIWKAKIMEGDVAPSPVFANGLLYVACDRTCIAAIKPDGAGDVTETHVAWKQEDAGLPDMCGLLCDGPRLYTLVFGVLYAFDSATGEELWQFETKDQFEASPCCFNGKLHLLTTKGEWITGTADNTGFKELSRNKLGEKCSASPAFMPGRIYLRGENNLYCIGTTNGG
jgi:outer membrane protein assembly factor BamB